MNKVAILYICTGKYDIFWKDFFLSYEKYFLPNCAKEYFVFTDAEKIYDEENIRVHKIYQKNLGWPDNTLKRFHIFLTIEDELLKYDYVFFMNANCVCADIISEEEFLPTNQELLVVKHPGYYQVDNMKFDYDRNPNSLGYIPYGEGKFYICGGVNGGKTTSYLNLMKTLKENIDIDEEKKIIAKWHDESHINKYILNRDDFRILTPAYCFPEGWNIPFEKKIVVRDKSKWIPVDKIKYTPKQRALKYLKDIIYLIWSKLHRI